MKLMLLAGGLPHYYNLVLNKLQRDFGIEICVIAPKGNGATLGAGVFESQQGIEFTVYFQEEYTTYYGKKFFRGLREIILKEKPNILMVSWPYQASFVFYPIWYLFLRSKKIALISKEIPFQVPYYNEAVNYYTRGGGMTESNQSHQKNKSLLARIKFIIVRETRKIFANQVDAHINYLDEAKAIHASYGVPPDQVFVTANSPDTDQILEAKKWVSQQNSIQPHPYRLLHVGRLVKWKQVDLLIQATIELRKKYPDTELQIVGDGPEIENLKTQVLEANASAYILFSGGIYELRELAQITMESGIYVLAGMGGLSINEAMCFEKPIICSIADGTEKRLVRENVNGYFFESGSLNSLVEKIEILFQHPEKMKAFGLKSLEIIEHEINIHTVLSSYMKAFEFAIIKANS